MIRLGRSAVALTLLLGNTPVYPTTWAASNAPEEVQYDWEQVPIGAGGFVTGIVSSSPEGGGAVYARTDVSGAYRWDESEQRWHQMLLATNAPAHQPLGPSDYAVASIAVAPSDDDVVYAAVGADFDPRSIGGAVVGEGRILRSFDGGQTWTPSAQRWFIAGNQRYRTGAERLSVDPDDPRHVLFGTQREGLWRSVDGGESWTQIDPTAVAPGLSADPLSPQAGVNFSAIVSDGGLTVLVAGVSHRGVVASVDGGAQWTLLHPLVEGEIPVGPAVSGGTMFVAVNNDVQRRARVVRIELADLSVSELVLPRDDDPLHIAVDPNDERRLILSTEAIHGDRRLWTTDDGGGSWRHHDVAISSPEIPWLEQTDLDEYMSVGRFMFDPVVPGRVWFAEGMAVWRADELGADPILWESKAVGIEGTVVNAVLPRVDGSVMVAVSDRQGFLLGPGRAYPDRPLLDRRFISGMSLDYSGGHPDVVAWVGGESHRGRLPDRLPRGAVSADGGRSWVDMESLERDQFAGEVAVSATDPDRVLWMPTAYEGPLVLRDAPVGIFVSGDGGRSWIRRTIDGRDGSFHRLYSWTGRRALAADRVNGWFYALSDEQRFFVSTDGGNSWTAAAHSPPCTAQGDCHVFGQVQAVPNRPETLFASTALQGLYRTGDAGSTPWERVEGLVEARAFGFGAPTASGEPTLFVHGRLTAADPLAILFSDDLGSTWSVIAEQPGGYGAQVNVVIGHPRVSDRVFVGFAGTGLVVGDARR